MTRTAAREIAIQICYASLLSGTPVDEVTDALFAPEYFATLSEENEIFRTRPNEKQLSYIRALTGQTDSHLEELNALIEKYSRDWKVDRISKVAATILRCAMDEILYLDEVPVSVTINEAVELAKGYEEPEPPAEEDVSMIVYTSGTTGKSKGVMLTQCNLYSNIEAVLYDEDPGLIFLSVLPVHHAFCLVMDWLNGF